MKTTGAYFGDSETPIFVGAGAYFSDQGEPIYSGAGSSEQMMPQTMQTLALGMLGGVLLGAIGGYVLALSR